MTLNIRPKSKRSRKRRPTFSFTPLPDVAEFLAEMDRLGYAKAEALTMAARFLVQATQSLGEDTERLYADGSDMPSGRLLAEYAQKGMQAG